MTDCVFCKVVRKELPSYVVYEDKQFLAILDISPVVEGHALVIPKKHYRWVHEVKEFGPFWKVAQKVAKSQMRALGGETVVFATAGFQVPHAHIHVLPMPKKKDGEFLPGVESAKRIRMSSAQLQETATKLRSSVK